VSDKLALRGEVSTGDGGLAGKAGVDYQYDDRSNLYMTYVADTGRTDENLIGRGGSLVTGVRSRVGDGLTLFTEHRQATGTQPGLTHAYGVQYAPDTRWTFGVNFENGWVGAETLGATRREAVAFTTGYSSERLKYSGGLEYRKDRTTAESRTSWLVKNSFSWKVSDDARWLGKFNWADSDSTTGNLAAAKYTEAMLGYALRPALDDRLNLLFKYTYLYDLSSPGQVVSRGGLDGDLGATVSTTGIDYQQRSHVFAIDATYDINARWTIGGKYAWRLGELRASRDSTVAVVQELGATGRAARRLEAGAQLGLDGRVALAARQGAQGPQERLGHRRVLPRQREPEGGRGLQLHRLLRQPDRHELPQQGVVPECAGKILSRWGACTRPAKWTSRCPWSTLRRHWRARAIPATTGSATSSGPLTAPTTRAEPRGRC
jgi:hypothetical protein